MSNGTWPGAYPWHDGSTDHHKPARSLESIRRMAQAKVVPVIPDLAKADNDQAAGVGVQSYARFAAPFGRVLGPANPSVLKHYRYEGKSAEVDDLLHRHGYKHYYAGGRYGAPDLAKRNYATGHLMVYDPEAGSGGDFGERNYTDNWRKIHELAHALTYPEVNKIYGEGRRIGKLGTHRSVHEAMRAVHWEDLAVHKQRELSKQIGVHISDHDFNHEYNTVIHDAVHRAVTGKFTEPSAEGFHPHEHKVPLSMALDMVRDEGAKMGLQQHGTLKKPGLAKGWPKDHKENQLNASVHGAFQDHFISQGGAPVPYQPIHHNGAGATVHDRSNPAVKLGPTQTALAPSGASPSEHFANRHIVASRIHAAEDHNNAQRERSHLDPLVNVQNKYGTYGDGEKFGHSVHPDISGVDEKAYWKQVDRSADSAAQRSPILKWKKYGGKHPVDAIGEQEAAHAAKLQSKLGKNLASPKAAGMTPVLHSDVNSFMGTLKALPKVGPDRGKFITAHMNHGPFLSALQAHPQGQQIHTMLTNHLNSMANAGPKGPMQVTAKSEPPVILAKQGTDMADEKSYTPAEAAEILKKAATDKIKQLEGQLQALRKRELAKAIIPPHNHNTGIGVGAGTEDVAAAKLNPPGIDKSEETTGPGEETTMAKEELCKDCGKSHGLDKCMGKAELVDSKGKRSSNSERSDASMPDDKGGKPVTTNDKGTGGKITKMAKSLNDLQKAAKKGTKKPTKPVVMTVGPDVERKAELDKAQPPMAKPPSGANMATAVPMSNVKPPKPAQSGLGKGVMSDIAQKNSPPGPAPVASGVPAKMPTPAAHAARAATHTQALAGAFQPKGPVVSGLELASPKAAGIAPKPGIFGRLAAKGK